MTVEWGASTLSDGAPVDGYLVKRYNFGAGLEQTVGAGCTGTRTTLGVHGDRRFPPVSGSTP